MEPQRLFGQVILQSMQNFLTEKSTEIARGNRPLLDIVCVAQYIFYDVYISHCFPLYLRRKRSYDCAYA